MNCSPNYTEWSREEKEELAKRRMDEMRLKNEKLLQRYTEVENDRIKAESRNSAITGAAKAVKKEKTVNAVEGNKEETKVVEYAREWDRGKPDMDHWKSPEHHGSSFKNYRSSGRNRKDSDRKDNWGSFSRNENSDRSRRGTDDSYEKRNTDRKDSLSGYSRNETSDHYKSDHAPDQRKLRGSYRFKQNDNNQHGSSRPQISPKRTRGVGYRNSDSHRKPQNSYSEDKFRRTDYNRSNSRKKYSYRAHSRSTSRSGSDHAENQYTIRAYNLWQNDKISEDQTKQNRVEKWVKSVNKTNMWGSKEFSPNPKIFAHDTKAKSAGKVPSEQKDKSSRSFSKFERYEGNSNKSSEKEYDAYLLFLSTLGRGNKSCENSNNATQPDYNETKNQNKGSAYNVGSVKQMEGMKKKGVQTTKRSPQYISGSSTKNENFRKQRRFDGKGQKDDEKNRYKSKMPDNNIATNDSWKNSTLYSTRNKTSSFSKLENADTGNQEDDGVWGSTDQSHIIWTISDEEAHVQETKNENKKEADGVWGSTDQSHIIWTISDDEADVQETKNENKKEAEKSSDMRDNWNDNQVASDSKGSTSKRQNEGNYKSQVPPDNDDGIWSNVEQSDIRWKTETEVFSQDGQNQNWEYNNSNSAVQSTAQKEAKKDTGCGRAFEDIDKSSMKNSSERKEELKTSGQKICNSGRSRRESDRKDNWGGFSRNENSDCSRRGTDDSYEKRNTDRKDSWSGYETTDHYSSDHAPDKTKLKGSYRFKQNDNNQHGSSHPQISPKRTRGVGYCSDSHRKPQNSYSEDKFSRTDYNRSNSRQKYSYRARSRSTNRSGSDNAENQFTIRANNLWQNGKISEAQTKQNRVESSKEFSPNPKIFAHDTKAKSAGKVPSEQKDKSSRSFSKFERYEGNSNKSSEKEYDAYLLFLSTLGRGNKSCENSNNATQPDYNETKNQNKGSAYNVGSVKQMEGMKKKGVQTTKRSPQYISGSSTKNENFRKQRRFDGKGQKDDEKNRYKSKMPDNNIATNDSWKNSTLYSTRNKTSSFSKLENADTGNQEDDGVWGSTDQSHIIWTISDEEAHVQETKNENKKEADGVWGSTDQSHIIWTISDDEADVQETKNENKKEAEKSSDMRDNWNDNQVASDSKGSTSKRQNEGNYKSQVPPDNDDGIWSNVEQSDIRWKTETEVFSQDGQNQNWEYNNSNSAVQSTAQKEAKKDTGCGRAFEDIDKSSMKNSSERKEELKTSGQKICNSGPNEGDISECHSNSASRQQDSEVQESHCDEDTIVNSFKRSVCISDEKRISVSVNCSDKPVTSDNGGSDDG